MLSKATPTLISCSGNHFWRVETNDVILHQLLSRHPLYVKTNWRDYALHQSLIAQDAPGQPSWGSVLMGFCKITKLYLYA